MGLRLWPHSVKIDLSWNAVSVWRRLVPSPDGFCWWSSCCSGLKQQRETERRSRWWLIRRRWEKKELEWQLIRQPILPRGRTEIAHPITLIFLRASICNNEMVTYLEIRIGRSHNITPHLDCLRSRLTTNAPMVASNTNTKLIWDL